MPTYGGTGGNYSNAITGAVNLLTGGGNTLAGAQSGLTSQQQASNNAYNANQQHGYGIQNQQVGNDLAHTMAGYGIDANNLQITGGTLNRQNQQLDASRNIAETQAILQKQQQDLQAAESQRAYNQNYSQGLSQTIATGAVNAAGNIGDRASAAQQLANQMTGYGQAKQGIDLDFQNYLQQYLGQKGDNADSRAHLGNDVHTLGNQQDAATTGAALQHAAINNNAAGASIQNATNNGGGGGSGLGGLSGLSGGMGTGAVGTNAQGQPVDQWGQPISPGRTAMITAIQNKLTAPNLANVGNRNNPLGVSDATWNNILALAQAQAGGANANSMHILQNLMTFFQGVQQHLPANAGAMAGASPGQRNAG